MIIFLVLIAYLVLTLLLHITAATAHRVLVLYAGTTGSTSTVVTA
jgi:hypothetical protein